MTLKDCAAAMKISYNHLSEIERGNRIPSDIIADAMVRFMVEFERKARRKRISSLVAGGERESRGRASPEG